MAHVVHPPSSGALEVCNCSADDRSEIMVHVFASNRSRHGALVAGVFFLISESCKDLQPYYPVSWEYRRYQIESGEASTRMHFWAIDV